MDTRYKSLKNWLSEQLSSDIQITPLLGDASFRRYFRIKDNQKAYIAMDSPPHLENPIPFVAICSHICTIRSCSASDTCSRPTRWIFIAR